MVQAIATSACRKAAARSDSFVGRNLPALEKMLWGGTVMLIIDHIINGELTWRFPFFTALGVEGGFETMLREMLTVGLPISVGVTAFWAVWCIVKERIYSTT